MQNLEGGVTSCSLCVPYVIHVAKLVCLGIERVVGGTLHRGTAVFFFSPFFFFFFLAILFGINVTFLVSRQICQDVVSRLE